jgi:prephenate dehydrogenase
VALAALRAVVDLVLSVDAEPVVLAADDHDRLVAAVSHVPHLVAYAVHAVATGLGEAVVDRIAGPSFRDATRVAASDPAFWADVTRRNGAAIGDLLGELQRWLTDALVPDATTPESSGVARTDEPARLQARLAAARRTPRRRDDGARTLEVADLTMALPQLRALGRDGFAVTSIDDHARGVRAQLTRR